MGLILALSSAGYAAPTPNERSDRPAVRDRGRHGRDTKSLSAPKPGRRDDRPERRGRRGRGGRPEDGPGRGFGDRRRGPAPPLWERMNDEEREHVLMLLEENFPRMFIELQRLKKRNYERYERRMSRVAMSVRELMEVMETNPERGELMLQERRLDMEIRYQVSKYRSTTDEAKRPKLRKQIRELCAEAFDCRHKRRELQIRELEARLAGLKQRHAQAQRMRKQLIAEEMRDRLDDADPFLARPKDDDDFDD